MENGGRAAGGFKRWRLVFGVAGGVLMATAFSPMAQTIDELKSSPKNMIRDSVMTDGLLVGGKLHTGYLTTYKYTAPVAVVGGKQYVISQGVDYQGAEWDSNMTFLRDIRMKHNAKNVVYTASPKAAFVQLNINNDDVGRYSIELSEFKKSSEPGSPASVVSGHGNIAAPGEAVKTTPVLQEKILTGMGKQWVGKKIAWYGTSIPAGYPRQRDQATWSYANKAAMALGATLLNYGVPNGVIRESKSDGSSMGAARDSLCFLKTTCSVNYERSLLALIGTPNEPDLFVFDYGVNDEDTDSSDFNRFDPLDPYNQAGRPDRMSITSRDKRTFIGAQNWVIDQLLKAKPNARIAFVAHFSKDAFDAEKRWERLIQIQNALGDYWGIPICRMYEKTGWINRDGNNTVKCYNPDGIHPASAPTTQSVDILSVIAADFLAGIF